MSRRLAVALALIACGCQRGGAGDPPPILEDRAQPGSDVAACAAITAPTGVLAQPRDCRSEGAADLDGDGIADCWRAVRGWPEVQAWVWLGCRGPARAIAIDLHAPIAAVALDETLAPAAGGIARVLAGHERVACERATADCPEPGPAAAWFLEATAPAAGRWHAYTPRWQAGLPHVPERAAIVRADRASLVVIDPDESDRELDVPPEVPLELAPRARCGRFTVWSSPWFTAVADAWRARWSWVLVRGDRNVTRAVACRDGLVLVPHTIAPEAPAVVAIDPEAGAVATFALDHGDFASVVADGVVGTQPALTLAQVHALAATPFDPRTPCAPAITGALLDARPDGPCTQRGQDDLDGDGTPDCWAATYLGNPAAGAIAWTFAIQPSCRGSELQAHADVNGIVRAVQAERPLPAAIARWVAGKLVGADHVRCVPATRDCAAPDPAFARALAQRAGTVAPVWLPGTPTAPAREAAILRDGLGPDVGPVVALFQPTGALAPAATCGNYDVWTAPFGGAAVDRKTGKWAWLEVDGDDPIVGARCGIVRIWFDTKARVTVAVEPKTGARDLREPHPGE